MCYDKSDIQIKGFSTNGMQAKSKNDTGAGQILRVQPRNLHTDLSLFLSAYLMTEEDYVEKKERLIPLTQGQFAIVDEDKYEELVKYKWYVQKSPYTYYAARNIHLNNPTENISIFMHQQILGYPTDCIIDHKNHNGLDNRVYNIRKCTHAQNAYNRRTFTKGKSGSIYKGVHLCPYYKKTGKGKKWTVSIGHKYKVIYLGKYDNEIEAAIAYDKKALELFGEFACTNF